MSRPMVAKLSRSDGPPSSPERTPGPGPLGRLAVWMVGIGLFGVPMVVVGAPAALTPAARAPAARRAVSATVVVVLVRQTYVRRSATSRSKHLGVVRRGARMVTRGLVSGPGCSLGWFRLAVGGFVCAGEVGITRQKPGGPRHPVVVGKRVLPFRYVAVGREGSGEYLEPADAASDYFLRQLGPRNAITVSGRMRYDGEWFYKTTRGTYVPASEVVRIRASRFAGQKLGNKWRLPLVFVLGKRVRVFRKPGRAGRARVKRFERFAVLETKRRWRRTYYRIGKDRWLRDRDVRLASRFPVPEGVGAKDRWIDVDVRQQVLTAYEGSKPVFTTLVSTGRRALTPLGSFRVWAKIAATDMRSRPRDSHHYQLWDVPWTVFFKGAYALHGTYWHKRFGYRKSAGCVNLSPRDARTLFAFMGPTLPAGWWAVLPRKKTDGTLVRVRDGKRLGRKFRKRRRRRRRRR
jgi:L,D-transpeptidase catalytic domain